MCFTDTRKRASDKGSYELSFVHASSTEGRSCKLPSFATVCETHVWSFPPFCAVYTVAGLINAFSLTWPRPLLAQRYVRKTSGAKRQISPARWTAGRPRQLVRVSCFISRLPARPALCQPRAAHAWTARRMKAVSSGKGRLFLHFN